MIFILAYGYLQMLIYLGSVCATFFVLKTLYSGGYFDKNKEKQYTDRLKAKEVSQI